MVDTVYEIGEIKIAANMALNIEQKWQKNAYERRRKFFHLYFWRIKNIVHRMNIEFNRNCYLNLNDLIYQ